MAVGLGVAPCLQLVEDDDIADPLGPKISMIVDNAQNNIVDFFMDFTLREAGPGPNFYLPVGELYLELPARRFDAMHHHPLPCLHALARPLEACAARGRGGGA